MNDPLKAALLAGLLLREDFDANRKNGIRVSLANVEMSLKNLDSILPPSLEA